MNIEEHKFSCDQFALVYKTNNEVYIYNEKNDDVIALTKDDVIALAKHFKLTADDIKE